MRAVLVKDGAGPVENLYIGETDKPSLKPGEVLVKIRAFGINRMDLYQRIGKYPPPPGASNILGVEFSGTVKEIGENINKWKVGDEVLGLVGGGAYAEYINVLETHLLPKPKHLSWAEAAAVPENWLTAFQALITIADLKAGESVMVHTGASGVGVAANQLASVYQAKNIITTASKPEKLAFLTSMQNPATHGVNYKTEDFAAEAKRITGGKGVDVIIDFVGQSHWSKNIDSLAFDGRMVLLAVLSGTQPQVDLLPILYKRLRIQGSTLRSRSAQYQAELVARFEREVMHKIDGTGTGLRVYIHKTYPWTEVQEAHKEMAADANIGKIICEITD